MDRKTFTLLILLLIISSCKLVEDKEGDDITGPTGTSKITLVSPNGGEMILDGSSYEVKWTGTGSSLIRLLLTADNGASWGIIADSLKNTGVYVWFPVPNVLSSQCKIRILTLDGTSSDESDQFFSIVKNSNKSLRVTSPIGGEKWDAGSSKQIKWFSTGIDSVKIEYTTDNGQSWVYIGTDRKNTGIYYWGTVPNTPSTLAKIRIKDAVDGVVSAQSPEPFEINEERFIKISAPASGDEWYAGSSDNIKWVSNNIQNVKIEYTTNGGGTWFTIVNSTPSTGVYSWNPIPDVSSLQCKLRISNVENNGVPSTISEENFTITHRGTQLIRVTSPNGGEKWASGTTHNIQWDASGIENVKIEYTINNGITWNIITESTPSTGFFTWNQVPNSPSTNCKIRISDASDGSPSDDSDNFFSITPAPSIVVKSPNGGETLLSGSTKSILYTSENVPNVKIEYTIDGGAHWETIVNSTPSHGTYDWEVPNLNSSQCKVKISDALFGDPSDISNNNFIITNVVNKSIVVISPNGGEDWEAGTKQNITWNSTAINRVKIELSTNQGASWIVLADNVSGGAYEWDISQSLNSTQCQIRLSDALDFSIADISDGTFIISPIKAIRVTGPTGPITFKDSDPITITWESSGIKTVGIKYTTTNGIGRYPDIPEFYPLVDKIANNGSFTTSFSIPSDQYYVVVFNADEGANKAPSARSTGNFTIVKTPVPIIEIQVPNGGEQWLASEKGVPNTNIGKYNPYEIKWRGTNLQKVKIEWSTNGGGNWYVVPGADSTENDGLFVWAPGHTDDVIPDSSDNCRIRISSVGSDIPAEDMSDGFFSIHKSKKIRVEHPNFGEDFYLLPEDREDPKSDEKWPMVLTWTSYAITSVNIHYSLDNGVTWNTLVTNYQSTGAFSWDFVFGLYANGPVEHRISTLGRIKIVDVEDSKVWDINDVPFWLNIKKSSGN